MPPCAANALRRRACVTSQLAAAPSFTKHEATGAKDAPPKVPAASDAMVTSKFGAEHGPGVRNAEAVLKQLWHRLGHDSAPKVAVVYVEPYAQHRVKLYSDSTYSAYDSQSDSTFNPFGHSAVAYPVNGRLTVMNIIGAAKPSLVNFMPLAEYLFDTHNWALGNEQGGVYNRTFRMVALWNVSTAQLDHLHASYLALQRQHDIGRADYNMVAPLALNYLGQVMPSLPHYGNCATFTSEGLQKIGILSDVSMWPKDVLMRAWQQNKASKMVTFANIDHVKATIGLGAMNGSPTSPRPSDLVESMRHWDLSCDSDAVVVVAAGQIDAEVIMQQHLKVGLAKGAQAPAKASRLPSEHAWDNFARLTEP